jgi:hypothetical protein
LPVIESKPVVIHIEVDRDLACELVAFLRREQEASIRRHQAQHAEKGGRCDLP